MVYVLEFNLVYSIIVGGEKGDQMEQTNVFIQMLGGRTLALFSVMLNLCIMIMLLRIISCFKLSITVHSQTFSIVMIYVVRIILHSWMFQDLKIDLSEL